MAPGRCIVTGHLTHKGEGCVEPVTAALARAAGELLGRTGRKDTVDAVVVATAMLLPTPVVVLTSDPGDIAALSEGLAGVGVGTVRGA